MPALYALPFVSLSAIAFFACVAVHRLRAHALQGLVAPLAFGACSLGSLALVVLLAAAIGSLFHLSADRFGAAGQAVAVSLGVLLYLCGGILGARWAAAAVRRLDATFLGTPRARRFIVRVVTALIALGVSSFVSMGVAEGFYPGSPSLWEFGEMGAASVSIGVLAGAATYYLAGRIRALSE